MSRASSHALKHPPAAARSPTTAAGSKPRPASPSMMAGRAWKTCRRSRPRWRWIPRARSSPATTRPISALTDRSIPIAAASMAASIALRARHPVGIVTKSALVTRDIDILQRMAKRNLVKVALSVTTLDPKLARTMEPRASTPPKRLEAIRLLAQAGIPATVMVAPVIPALNDSEIERILDAAAHAGAKEASYVLLRLPLEVRDLFREWLMANYPDRYRHVFTMIRDMRGGRDYDSQWGTRMKGTGPMAWMIGRRFEIACEKLGLNKRRSKLTTDHFARPKRSGQQLSLF